MSDETTTVRFQMRQRVDEYWNMEVEVPQSVVDEGDKALREYIMVEGNDLDPDYLDIEDSYIEENFIDVDKIEVQ